MQKVFAVGLEGTSLLLIRDFLKDLQIFKAANNFAKYWLFLFFSQLCY